MLRKIFWTLLSFLKENLCNEANLTSLVKENIGILKFLIDLEIHVEIVILLSWIKNTFALQNVCCVSIVN